MDTRASPRVAHARSELSRFRDSAESGANSGLGPLRRGCGRVLRITPEPQCKAAASHRAGLLKLCCCPRRNGHSPEELRDIAQFQLRHRP
jgi:hypothetical protein